MAIGTSHTMARSSIGKAAVHSRESDRMAEPSLPVGAKVKGPAVIEEPNATTFIHPGDIATVSEHGHLVIDVKL